MVLELNSDSCGPSNELLRIVESQNQTDTDPTDNDPNFDFTGRYRLTKSENFDKYLEQLGVGIFQRTIANKASSEYEIVKDGEKYTLRTISPFSTSEISFALDGKEFDERRMDGTTVRSSVVRKGRKWVHTQRNGDQVVNIVREWKNGTIFVSSVLNDVAFLRIYKKLTDEEKEVPEE